MAREHKDRSGNWYIERHGGALLSLAPVQGVVSWTAAHNVLSFPKQVPDGLLDVMFEGKETPDPFLIEIESYPDQQTLEQLRKDVAMVLLTRGVVPDIIVLVLRPKGKLRIAAEHIATSAHGLTAFALKVHVIHLWEIPADALLTATDIALVPWAPLADFVGEPTAILERCRAEIVRRAKPEEVENLITMTRVMAEVRYNDLDLLTFFGGPTMWYEQLLLETPTVQRLLDRKMRETEAEAEKAVEKATRETKRETTIEHIQLFLRKRFGELPKDLAAKVRAIKNQTKLDRLLETAGDCPSLAAFRKSLGKA